MTSADEFDNNDEMFEGPWRSGYNLLKTPRFALEVMRAYVPAAQSVMCQNITSRHRGYKTI